MTALALLMPFLAPRVPGGLLGGGTQIRMTYEVVMAFLRDLKYTQTGNLFPKPPAVPVPAVVAGAALVASELVFPRPAGSQQEFDPSSGLDPYGNPLDPQAPGAANSTRGDAAYVLPPNMAEGYREFPAVGTISYTYYRKYAIGAMCDCADGSVKEPPRVYFETTDTFTREGQNASWKTDQSTKEIGCPFTGTSVEQKTIFELTVDGEVVQTIDGVEGKEESGFLVNQFSKPPHQYQLAELRNISWNGEDYTPTGTRTGASPVAVPAAQANAVPTPQPLPEPASNINKNLVSGSAVSSNNPSTPAKPLPVPGSITQNFYRPGQTNPVPQLPAVPESVPIIRPGLPAPAPAIPAADVPDIPALPGLPGFLPDTNVQTGRPISRPPLPPATTDPLTHFPVPNEPGIPPNPPPRNPTGFANELGRIERKAGNLLEKIANFSEILGNLYDWLSDQQPHVVDPDTYLLKGVCEALNDDGEQPVFSTPVLGGRYEPAVISRLDAMQYLLQAHLGYKTPVCHPPSKDYDGDYRTITFVSDEQSPEGRNRIRKRFRYRSSSGVGLSGVVDHWKDFVWSAGNVCVSHRGSPLGAPQVWADSIDEAKRVIRHAGGEAGIDPDQIGEWRVGGSDNPRYGMPGTMRVNTKGGYYWISSRLGPDERPTVAKT